MKNTILSISLVLLCALVSFAQSPNTLRQRCPVPNNTTYSTITIDANGVVTVTPCINKNAVLSPTGTGVVSVTHALVSVPVSITDNGTTLATDASTSNTFRSTALTAGVTLSNPTNPTNGERITWEIIQNASSAHTLAFGNKFAFGAEITDCTISTNLSSHNFITAIYNSTTDKFYVVGCVTGY